MNIGESEQDCLKNSIHFGNQIQEQNLKTYKKNLLYKVILVLIILSIFVLERIFYWYLLGYEVSLLENVQESLKITYDSSMRGLFEYSSRMGLQKYYLIIQTHFYVTIYVGVDGILSLKIMTMHFLGVYMMNLLVMLYSGGRPYWISEKIISFECVNTYGHPSIMTFSLLFWLCYSYECYAKGRKQLALIQLQNLTMQHKVHQFVNFCFIFALLLLLGLLALTYLQGNIFFINIFLSLCIFIVYYLLIFQVDSQVNNLIKKFTIMKLEAKKNIFYWFLFVIIAQLVNYFVYINNADMNDIAMIKQYIKCANANHLNYQYDEHQNQKDLIGPYEQYQDNFILLALLGGILGATKTFQKLVTVHWFRGSLKAKLGRILLINISVIPLWLIYSLDDHHLLHNPFLLWFGLNPYSINCIIYFLNYYFLFGILPSYIFPKLKLTTIQLSHYNNYSSTF